jgi:serine/threonine protein kinase
MEILQGGTLKDKFDNRVQFSDSEASEIIKGILCAVAYLHKNEIIHRDLKPENIMF